MNLKRISSFSLILTLLLTATLLSVNAAPPAQEADYDIPNGHFYTQTSNGQGGFSVVDDEQARFWGEFQRLGGLQTVGYPISHRYERDGFVTQAFQKLILQWRPEADQAWPVNVFDELSRAGFDQKLLSTRQTPLPIESSEFDAPDASWGEIVANRQSLLDANSAIRDRYFSVSNPLNVFGLPTSYVEDMGNHDAIRTQRAVFQQWTQDVPWADEGDVTIANGGDIAKELGALPAEALVPESAPDMSGSNIQIYTLLVGPGNPGRLYALTNHDSLFISDNLGESWRPFAGGLPITGDCLHNLDMDYATVDALYASTCEGLYRWDGSDWTKISSQQSSKIAVVYGQPEALWGIGPLGASNVIIRSTDGGVTWRAANTGLPRGRVLDIAIDPHTPDTLYALGISAEGGTYLARGNTSGLWSVVPASEKFSFGTTFSIDGSRGHLYITAASTGELWYTQNPKETDGANIKWELVHDFDEPDVDLLASGNTPDGLALYINLHNGEQTEAMTSLNEGRSWNTWKRMNLP